MIKKINKIKNVGSFWLFSWSDVNPATVIDYDKNGKIVYVNDHFGNKVPKTKTIDNDFKKYNIFYGENGTGKSTIVSIFKSLNSNSKDLKKHWDKGNEVQEIQIERTNAAITFQENTGWDNSVLEKRFIFFDRDFINDNVHSGTKGRNVEHDKKTGEIIIYLGDFYNCQELLDRLVSFKNYLSAKNEEFLKREEEKYFALFDNIQEFSKSDIDQILPTLTIIDRKQLKEFGVIIENKKKELNIISVALKEQKVIENLKETDLINLSENLLAFDFNKVPDLLEFTVSSAVIEIINKIKNKADFVQQGLLLIENESLINCPLCEQKIKNGDYIDIIKQYQRIFDQEFRTKQEDILRRLTEYENSLFSILAPSFVPEHNTQRLIDIKKYISVEADLPAFKLTDDEQKILREELKIIQEKKTHTLKYYESKNLDDIRRMAEKVISFIENYNSIVLSINTIVMNYRKDLEEGKKLKEKEKLSEEIKRLEINKFTIEKQDDLLRYIRVKEKYENNNKVADNINRIFKILRDKVKYYFKEFTDNYFGKIKKYIEDIDPTLLVEPKCFPNYDLRTSTPVTCGFEVHYRGKDRLKEISEGERQVIALSYFFALLENEKKKEDKIIVFDDPITSFDAGKRKNIAELIHYKTLPFLQILIFTCDPLFKQYCIKAGNKQIKNNKNRYYILRAGSSCIFHTPKSNSTIYSSFKKDFRNIGNVSGTDENIVIYGQKLRFCLETEIKEKYLGHDKERLDEILEVIQQKNYEKLKNVIDKIRSIYSYCNTGGLAHYPRNGATSWVELTNHIKKYLSLNL